jgi:hypothetical protein
MRVYTKVVLNMEDFSVVDEEFYEYSGDTAECKSGGAGGGSPTGTIAYPAYMQTAHNDWLNHTAADTMVYSVVDLMNAAMSGQSPFSGFTTVDVDDAFLGPNKILTNYIGPYDKLHDFSCFDVEAKYNEYITDDNALIAAAVDAESDLMDDEINSRILPKFQAGMLDINAVNSSAFVIGEALIWDSKNKALAKFSSGLRIDRLNGQAEIALKRIQVKSEFHRIITTIAAELARLYIAARHDIDSLYTELAAKDRLFDLNIYQYGVNVMSSIAGSAVSPPDPGSNKSGLGGALSGALAGAAMGAMIPGAGPIGAIAGGVLGLAGGIFG